MAKRKLPTSKAFGSNIASVVTDRRHLRDIGGMFLGASLYAMVPTLISKAFKVDTSGIKGVLLGIGAGLVGAGFGGLGFAVFAGSVGAMFGHLWWSQLNGRVAYPLLNQYLWRWDPTAKGLGLQSAPQAFGDNMAGNVATVRLPNGKTVPIYNRTPTNILPEAKTDGLQDYKETLADYQTNLADYAPTLADYQASLNDELLGASQFDEQYSVYDEQM